MKSHPDYPIINQIESFLISNRPATKLLSESKCLVESKHTADSVSDVSNMPSDDSLGKISKINPYNVKSSGNDSNANIKAFVCVTLETAFNSRSDEYENFLIQKIAKQTLSLVRNSQISNQNHDGIPMQGMIKVVVGFLKTLKYKKLKNPEQFDLKIQLQRLPIIVEYLTVISRGILSSFEIQEAENYRKKVQDSDCFDILSEYWDLNLIKRQSYYFFEETAHFIFKNQSEFVFGNYGSEKLSICGKNQRQEDDNSQRISAKLEKNYNLKILECSMESGSNLVSSRHVDQSTPYFNNVGQEMFFKAVFKKQNPKEANKSVNDSNSIRENQTSAMKNGIGSKSSGFQVNVYSEESKKCFNNKYSHAKYEHKNVQSMKQRPNQQFTVVNSPSSSQNNYSNAKIDKLFIKESNQTQPKNVEVMFKKAQIKSNLPSKPFTQLQRAKSDECVHQILKFDQNIELNNKSKSKKYNEHQNWQKIFQQENDERRLRRVQTICYKTCTTCHRRFYKNQIKSNLINIKIDLKTQQKDISPIKIQNYVTGQVREEVLNKKLHKKSADTVIQTNKSKSQEQNKPCKSTQKQKSYSNNCNNGSQFSWLRRKMKTETQNVQQNDSIIKNALSVSPHKRQFKKQLSPKFSAQPIRFQAQNPKSNDSNQNLKGQRPEIIANKFTLYKEKSSNLRKNNPKEQGRINLNSKTTGFQQNKDGSTKIQPYLAFKGSKQLEKVKSIGNIEFKHRISNPSGLIRTKFYAGGTQNLIIENKSAQKKTPGFLLKDSVKNDFIFLMN